jgi:alkylation response protein AidB-like acyl-CoA dehydrogenase
MAGTGGGDDEIRQLRKAVQGTLGTTREALPHDVDTTWRSGWPALAELGVTGLCVPEAKGGFGLRVDACVAVAMDLGAALHPAPFAGTVACAHVLGTGSAAGLDALLAGVLDGSRVCAYGRLSGDGRTARLVDGAAASDALLLIDPSGLPCLFTDPAGWSAQPIQHPFDVSRSCADVVVDPAFAEPLVPGSIQTSDALYRLLLCADTVGGLERVLDRTVAYAKERQAFGRALAGFQAVQHRLVDHAVRSRGMTLLLTQAARSIDTGDSAAVRSVAIAEVSISQTAAHIIHDLLQLTGAIGFTWEYGLHFFDRRAHHNARLAANPRAAITELAAIEGWSHAG